MPPQTVPSQYRTGKTLSSGAYAVIKEAVHIKTGTYYASKIIKKKLAEGREHMVRNEIQVLNRVSRGHRNIVTLHDIFETSHNLYLIFDLCTGGELLDRICAKGNYFEADAAALVRTIMGAVQYIHSTGIVHRDLKPENLLFRTKEEDADIVIAGFRLSRVMDEDGYLTEVCGTPGYTAPEVFKKTGYGKPVDIWAIGVITCFLLCGYTPFNRHAREEEARAILQGDYKFEPTPYWAISETAHDFIKKCLTVDPSRRPTAEQLLKHKWLADAASHFVADPVRSTGQPFNLLPHTQMQFDAREPSIHTAIPIKHKSMSVPPRQAGTENEYSSHSGEITYTHEDAESTMIGEAVGGRGGARYMVSEGSLISASRGIQRASQSEISFIEEYS